MKYKYFVPKVINEEIAQSNFPSEILDRLNIDCSGKRAVRLNALDYSKYDYFIGMDFENIHNMKRLFNGDPDGKVHLLLDFTNSSREVADPWWTRNFEQTYLDIKEGIEGLYNFIDNTL